MTNNTPPNTGGWTEALMQCIRKRFAAPKPAPYEPPNPAPRRRDAPPIASMGIMRDHFRELLRPPTPEPGVALRKVHLSVAHHVLSMALSETSHTHAQLDGFLLALDSVLNAARSTPEPESPHQ